jgi:hypothetical protein
MTAPTEQFVSSRDSEVRAVLAEIGSGLGVTAAHLSPLAASADQPVAVDRADLAAAQIAESPLTHRDDGHLVEHDEVLHESTKYRDGFAREVRIGWRGGQGLEPEASILRERREAKEAERQRRLARWQEQR